MVYICGSNRGGGGGNGRVVAFLRGVSNYLLDHFHGILNLSSVVGILSSSLVDCHHF